MLLFILPPLLFTAGAPNLPRIEILSNSLRPLAPSFYASTDPEPSFDAKRVLFAGKRTAADVWQVYEHDLASRRTRQITHGGRDARFPAYQSRIFTLDAPTPWDQVVFVSDGNLHTCKLDGTECHPITFHAKNEKAGPPTVAWDGRVLYPVARDGSARLYGVNLDGTDVALFSEQPVDMAKVATTEETLYFQVGGEVRTLSLLRPSLPSRLFARASYAEPVPKGGVLLVRGSALMMLNGRAPEMQVFKAAYPLSQPRALVRRPLPDGRGSVVDTGETSGVLYCLSANNSDASGGDKAKFVRIHIEGREAVTTELAKDGSFHLKLPANTPVSVETLDESRRSLRRSANFWVRNKENRGCIGCHENPELTPDNRFVEALRAKPVDLTRTSR